MGMCRILPAEPYFFGVSLAIPTSASDLIEITINGEKRRFKSGLTIEELLSDLELNSRAIAVEINQQIQPRDTHHLKTIQQNDVLEIVTLVGGG